MQTAPRHRGRRTFCVTVINKLPSFSTYVSFWYLKGLFIEVFSSTAALRTCTVLVLLIDDNTLHFIYTKSSCDTLQTSPASSTGLRCPLQAATHLGLPLPSGREHYSRHTLGVLLSLLALRLQPHYHHITLTTKFIKQSLVYSKAVVRLETEAKRIHLHSTRLCLQEQV